MKSPPLEARHEAFGLNSRFNGEQLSFAEYVALNRDMIRKVRLSSNTHKLDQATLDKVIDGNAPFSLEPTGDDIAGREKKYRRGILLTHGLSDSPYFMHHVARFFQAEGFRVMAVLLPGHGTRPGDLLEVRWQEWARAVALALFASWIIASSSVVSGSGTTRNSTMLSRRLVLPRKLRENDP